MKQLLVAILSVLLACQPAFTVSCSRQHRCETAQETPRAADIAERENNAVPEKRDSPEDKRIWLTFDDGPTDSTTPKILDVLESENVKATFFVIGSQITGREKILRREADGGHTIGIHTYSHEYKKIYASADALRKDIALCSEAIRSVLPDFCTDIYRFPGGSFNVKKELIAAVEQAGYRHYDWNASAEDAVSPNAPADELYRNVLASAGEKSDVILLMHDGVGYKGTVQCLPSVIGYFRKKGYLFCTF